ncbi:MAG: hypothetical protein ACRD3D_00800 [Terriglobia bacterium]
MISVVRSPTVFNTSPLLIWRKPWPLMPLTVTLERLDLLSRMTMEVSITLYVVPDGVPLFGTHGESAGVQVQVLDPVQLAPPSIGPVIVAVTCATAGAVNKRDKSETAASRSSRVQPPSVLLRSRDHDECRMKIGATATSRFPRARFGARALCEEASESMFSSGSRDNSEEPLMIASRSAVVLGCAKAAGGEVKRRSVRGLPPRLPPCELYFLDGGISIGQLPQLRVDCG